MHSRKLYLFLVMIFIIIACNPQSIRRSRLQDNQAEAQPDSFLYYQPMAINDSFLDSLTSVNDKEEVLKVRLIPPPPPPAPKTKQVTGYRIQTFAGLDSINAITSIEKLKTVVQDSIYFLREKGLFKIQFGDYVLRNDADLKVLDIRKSGISGAWVVSGMVNIPIDSLSSKAKSLDTAQQISEALYKIQVLVTSDLSKAETLTGTLKEQFYKESYFIESGSMYKIFLGKFNNRSDAEKVLEQVKKSGYPDAWLVYKK